MYAVLKTKFSYRLKQLIKDGEEYLNNLKLFVDNATNQKSEV
jgi:hypothetical protein